MLQLLLLTFDLTIGLIVKLWPLGCSIGSTLTGRIAACKNPSIGSKMKSVSEELRLGRLSRRLSQAEVAAKAGFSTATLSRIEKGEKQPSHDEILAIAKVLEQTSAQSSESGAEATIAKLADTRKRLKIEISLEELSTAFEGEIGPKGNTFSGKSGSPLILYVDIDAFDISEKNETGTENDSDEEEMSPYSRGRERG